MSKEILLQYSVIMEEIKDIRRRIQGLNKFLDSPPIVADTVTGSHEDLTIGSIKVTGIPDPVYHRKARAKERYKKLLDMKEGELSDMTVRAERYIESIQNPELRIMLRLYYIDGYSDPKVAHCMNQMFPKRGKKYTDENIKKRRQRFLKKI